MTRAALILAGGAGTRLWPLSSDDNPKQFLRLFGGESLLQKTWSRLARLVPADSIFISTNLRYRDKCIEQLPALPPSNVLTEPARRNTAAAIALCCFEIASRLGEETAIGCFPADHFVGNEDELLRVIGRGFDFAETSEHLVTVGIEPTEPHTGYGYLELGDALAPGVIALQRFVEKPDLERARQFLAAGNYAWNGGIFLWRASVFRRALQATSPEIAQVTYANYSEMPSISIDYALMEKAPRVATVRGDFDWSDVGSWAAVARLGTSSPALVEEASGVFVQAAKPVAVVGVSNVAVIDSPEGILVLDLAKSELMATVVKKLPS